MKNEEAHRFLEDLQRKYTRDRHWYKPEFIEANGLAILALEKQIPIEHHHTAIRKPMKSLRVSICPNCLKFIYTAEHEFPLFCNWCGHAIDWSDI